MPTAVGTHGISACIIFDYHIQLFFFTFELSRHKTVLHFFPFKSLFKWHWEIKV